MWRAAYRLNPRAIARVQKELGTVRFRYNLAAKCPIQFHKLQARYFASATTNDKASPVSASRQSIEQTHHKRQQNPPPENNNKPNKKVTLKERTNRILLEDEDWTQAEWNTAVSCLNSWARYPKKNLDSLIQPFEILERMALEAQKSSDNNFLMAANHINQALLRWKNLASHPKVDKREWSAPNVLAIMDKLTSLVPSATLDTKSYAMIMAGHIQQHPSNAQDFCTELVQRMENSNEDSTPNTVIYNYLMEAHIRSHSQDGPAAALSVFDKKLMQDDSLVVPDEKSLTRVFQALLLSNTPVIKAIPYIQRAITKVLKSSQEPKAALSSSTFLNLVLEYCQERLNTTTASSSEKIMINRASMVPLADALLTVAEELSNQHPPLTPDGNAYSSMIHLWANSQLPDSAKNADAWLEKLLLPCDEKVDSAQQPDMNAILERHMSCYAAVVQCYSTAQGHAKDDRVGALLNEMMEVAVAMAENQQSKPVDYSLVTKCWASSGVQSTWPREGELMDYIVQRIESGMNYKMKGGRGSVGKLKAFTTIARDLVNSDNSDKAVALLERAASEYPGVYGELETGTELCHVVVKSVLDDTAERRIEFAKLFLERVTTNYVNGTWLVKPSSKSFGAVMVEGAIKGNDALVGELWVTLQDLQSANGEDPDFMPDADVLTALFKTNTVSVAKGGSVLHRMLKGAKARNDSSPSEALLDFVFDSLAKSGDPTAGKRAETILLKMQELYEEGMLLPKPTFRTFEKVIACWATCDEDGCAERAEEILGLAESLAEAGDKPMQPSCNGYILVMNAWGRSHEPDAPERIQSLVRRMKQKGEEGKLMFVPSEEVYIALLSAYANSGRDDAGQMAQTVFDGAPAEFKGTRLFNSLIAAQGGDSNRAEAILHEMHKSFLDGNATCKPDTESFNNVLLAWSRSGSPMAAWRADSIFQRMSDLTEKGDLDVRPNGKTFDIVITVISNEWGSDAATKVDHYLELLKEYYSSDQTGCIPGVASYTEAIRAWGSNVDDPRAVLRAKALLDEMHELARAGASGVKPDRETYFAYLHALSRSTLEDREDLARDALLAMKQDSIVLDQDLISLWQRCSLPMKSVDGHWTVLQEDSVEFPTVMTPTKDKTLNAILDS